MGATLRESVRIEGEGLHTGEPSCVWLHPYIGGIWFTKNSVRFPARWDYVCATRRCTTLGDQAVRIATVEHLLAAFWGQGITDCLVEVVRGEELPILDGSALPFVQMIEEAGTEPSPTASLRLSRTVLVQDGEGVLAVAPGADLAFGYIQFPEPIGVQAGVYRLETFSEQLAPARTFGFMHELEALHASRLALGGSLQNALVIDEKGYYNEPRFPDEPLRHKLLDALGDLYLCGYHLTGFHLTAIKSGHRLALELARQVALAFQSVA